MGENVQAPVESGTLLAGICREQVKHNYVVQLEVLECSIHRLPTMLPSATASQLVSVTLVL